MIRPFDFFVLQHGTGQFSTWVTSTRDPQEMDRRHFYGKPEGNTIDILGAQHLSRTPNG